MALPAIEHPGNARSRRTRRALLTATRAILEEQGFEALTMSAIAERSGVTRRSVYLHFASRAEVVDALYAFVAETEGLQESVAKVWAAPDSVAALREWAHHFARYHPRVLTVDRALHRVYQRDVDAAAHRNKVLAGKRASLTRLASWLQSDGRLAEPWTVSSATDMLLALATSDVIESLVVDRRWSRRRFAEHYAHLLHTTFVRDADQE